MCLFYLITLMTSLMTKQTGFFFLKKKRVMVRQITSARNRSFAVKVVFPFDETFEITDVLTSMTVLALKDRIELASGIPR